MLSFYRNLSKLKLSNLVSSVFSIVGKFSCIVSGQEVVFVLFRFEPPVEAHCDCLFPSMAVHSSSVSQTHSCSHVHW